MNLTYVQIYTSFGYFLLNISSITVVFRIPVGRKKKKQNLNRWVWIQFLLLCFLSLWSNRVVICEFYMCLLGENKCPFCTKDSGTSKYWPTTINNS